MASATPFSADRITVELQPHDPAWKEQAVSESVRLSVAMDDALVLIEHMGSTAVPGLAAKPVIDLVASVTSLAALDARRAQIEAQGYEWRGEFGMAGRRYCTRDIDGARRFNLHCFEATDAETHRMRAFRDYLRIHPLEARAYEARKRSAAAAHPGDVQAYNAAKSEWLLGCRSRALAWASARVG